MFKRTLKRTSAYENLHTQSPLIALSKKEFINGYIYDQFEFDYPEITPAMITAHIEGMMVFHRLAQIVKPVWLTLELAEEIHDEMQLVANRGIRPC